METEKEWGNIRKSLYHLNRVGQDLIWAAKYLVGFPDQKPPDREPGPPIDCDSCGGTIEIGQGWARIEIGHIIDVLGPCLLGADYLGFWCVACAVEYCPKLNEVDWEKMYEEGVENGASV